MSTPTAPVRTGSGRQTSHARAPIRGCARAARRSACLEMSRATPGRPGSRSSDGGEVVARARAGVQHAALARVEGRRALGDQLGERGEVAAAEEVRAGGDHLRGVGGAEVSVAGQQVGVALPGDVERVPGRAAQGRPVDGEVAGAEGAAEVRNDIGEHSPMMMQANGRFVPPVVYISTVGI